MARKQIINGKVYDWSSVTIGVSGCNGIEPQGIDYSDEKEKTPVYRRGGKIAGYGTGDQKNSVKLTLLREDYNLLDDAMGTTSFYDYIVPKITVSYADTGATTCTDTLNNVTFSKRSFKPAHGDTSETVELEGIAVGGILINGRAS